jgi:hypothetical protein
MERIEVTSRGQSDGPLDPVAFTAGREIHQVKDVGRRWDSEDGRHMLVMDTRGKTFHLFYQLSDLSWYWVRDIKPSANRI